MPTTPVFDLPYPGPGDPNNVPVDLAALALRVEDILVGIDAANLTSGVYTPTLTAVVNVDLAGPVPLTWTRIGDVVTVDGATTVQATAAGPIQLGISLPVPSNLAASTDLSGIAAVSVSSTSIIAGVIAADSTNDRATLFFPAPDTSNRSVKIHFAYKVI